MSKNVEIPELGLFGLIRFAWRQLTSMRTALILLMMLGVAAVPGSLIPQRTSNPIGVRDFFEKHPGTAPFYGSLSLMFMDRLGLARFISCSLSHLSAVYFLAQ